MADNSLPDRDLSEERSLSKLSSPIEEVKSDERRKFMQRAAIVGLPVVLATVRGRTVFASGGTASCPGSMLTSTCG